MLPAKAQATMKRAAARNRAVLRRAGLRYVFFGNPGFCMGSFSPNASGTYANRTGNASDRNMMPKRDWTEMEWPEVAAGDTKRWIAVLPVAAVEQHGPHLPLGVDSYIAQAYIARVLPLLPADLPATFLPIQQIGQSDEHRAFPGTLSFSAPPAIPPSTEIAESTHPSPVPTLSLLP